MSTSTPGSTLGDCVVCGTRTATRCSECASNGTKWMYFCSRDHQKLIYKTHKRVCGKLSSPLRWPILTEKEAERYKKLGSLRTPHLGHETFAEVIKSRALLPYDVMLGNLQRPYGGSRDKDTYKFNSLAMLRGASHAVRNTKPGSDGVPHRSRTEVEMFETIGSETDPYELTLYELGRAWPALSSTCTGEQWWEPLMHRSIIFYDLLAKVQNWAGKEGISKELCESLIYTHDKVVTLLEEDVSKTHPREAARLAKQLEEETI